MQLPSPVGPMEGQPPAPGPSNSSAPEPPQRPAPSSRSRTVLVTSGATRLDVVFLGCLGLVATLTARVLAPALPGISSGISPLISEIERVAGFSSQFLAVLGVATCVRLLLTALERRSSWFRFIAIGSCASALPIVVSASSRHLPALWLMCLVGLSAVLGLLCALTALRVAHSRAAGLAVLTVTLGSVVSAAARALALFSSQDGRAALFSLARGVASLGLLLDALSIALVVVWVGRRWRPGAALLALLAGLAAPAAWLGSQAVDSADVDAWQMLLGRALSALTTHPDPFIDTSFRYFVQIYALLVAGVTLWLRRPMGVGQALCFALLARVAGDIPACALLLMLSALCAVRASLEPVLPNDSAPGASGRRAPLEVVPATR
jgi:hypothetical protein